MTAEISDAAALDLARYIRPGAMVAWGQGCAEPLTLTETLAAQREQLGGVRCFAGISTTAAVRPEHCDYLSFSSYTAAGAEPGAERGRAARHRALPLLPAAGHTRPRPAPRRRAVPGAAAARARRHVRPRPGRGLPGPAHRAGRHGDRRGQRPGAGGRLRPQAEPGRIDVLMQHLAAARRVPSETGQRCRQSDSGARRGPGAGRCHPPGRHRQPARRRAAPPARPPSTWACTPG